MTARDDLLVPPGRTTRAARGRPSGRHRGDLISQDRRLGYALVAPVVIVLLVITAYPLFYNLWNSFHNVDYLNIANFGSFAGGSNYALLFTAHAFLPALLRTLGFTAASVAIETAVGLGIALVLNRQFPGRGIVRAAVFIPWAVPTVVSAELWKTMFDPQSGFVNYILVHLHLPLASTAWLDGTWTAWAAILVADAWRNTPFMAIVLLAGLQIIPRDIYEAAKIDGAGSWQTFRRLTLPLLMPALMVALIFRTLSSFLIFDVVYIMTGGGPGTSTQVLSVLNYQAFLDDFNFGYGGAIAVAMVVLALFIAAIYVRVLRTDQQA
jgi:multiple sugar transport system permease protein